MDNQLSYDREIPSSFESLHKEHQQVLTWVGKGKKVLEVACHTGYISAWLHKQGCDVTGLEIYGPALERAKPYLIRSILGDIEKEETWAEIKKEKYDVVLYMHILEHLTDPQKILDKTREILNENGVVIICLPNINNWEDRWKIFKGNFNYTEIGVMDHTHLRFYNYYTAIEMINKAGFRVEAYCGKSWKAVFRPFPKKPILQMGNIILNKIFHTYGHPNLTDKILMFKASAQ